MGIFTVYCAACGNAPNNFFINKKNIENNDMALNKETYRKLIEGVSTEWLNNTLIITPAGKVVKGTYPTNSSGLFLGKDSEEYAVGHQYKPKNIHTDSMNTVLLHQACYDVVTKELNKDKQFPDKKIMNMFLNRIYMRTYDGETGNTLDKREIYGDDVIKMQGQEPDYVRYKSKKIDKSKIMNTNTHRSKSIVIWVYNKAFLVDPLEPKGKENKKRIISILHKVVHQISKTLKNKKDLKNYT